MVNTSFNKCLNYGDDSGTTTALTGTSVSQGDAAGDQHQLLIKYVHPTQRYNFPIASPLSVQFGLIPNNVFDVAEQKSDGSVKTRTFKMAVSASLKIHNNNGSVTNQLLKTNENNLGEYLYTVYAPVVLSNGSRSTSNQLQQTNNTEIGRAHV